MVNWKLFEITYKTYSISKYVRFDLDRCVNFSDRSEKRIYCAYTSPYCSLEKGDYIKVDVDRARCYSSMHDFDDNSIVREVSSSNSGALVRVKNDYCALQSTNSSLQTSNRDLQLAKRNLESRISDLQRDRDSWRSSSWSLQTERDSLKEQVREKNELIRSGEVVLRHTQNQLTNTQSQLTTTQNQLARRNTEYDDLNCRFNNLQIENNNKDNEIKTKEEKILSLKVKLGEAEEDILKRELISKEKKLDELTRNLAIEPPQKVKELREAYERLIKARENYNRDGVAVAQRDIDARKQELLQTDISVDNLYKVYRNCEKVAEVRIKLEKIHEQRFEARQEVPTNN